jgi:hypothetical protein
MGSGTGRRALRRAPSRLVLEIDVGQRLRRTMKQASVSSALQGGGKRRVSTFSTREPAPPRSRLERRQLAVEPRRQPKAARGSITKARG